MNTDEISSKSTPTRINAVEHLHLIAIEVARSDELEFHAEKSHSSEAVYCSIRRGRYWYGVRIAAHEPAYACSSDYLQVLVPLKVAELTTLTRAERQLRHAVKHNEHLIADPADVNAALMEATEANFQRTGRIRLPNSDACAIRHRLHFRARWTFDEEQATNSTKR